MPEVDQGKDREPRGLNAAAPTVRLRSDAHARGSLARRVRAADRRQHMLMLALVAPTVAFIGALFLAPIAAFMFRGIDNRAVPDALPETLAAIRSWQPETIPDEAAFAALARDLRALVGSSELPLLGRRLNQHVSGFRNLIIRTARRISPERESGFKEHLIALDGRWGEIRYWSVIKSQGGRFTSFYFLTALDLRMTEEGSVARADPDGAVFLALFARTVWISVVVTALCLAIGFPVTSVMVTTTPNVANVLFMMVLLPFWTSLLVRSVAWVILLQNEGVVNQALIAGGILAEPAALVFNRTGLYIAMVYVLLPFMILPLYSVQKGIPGQYMRAAASLGARPLAAFRYVYLPQLMPGIVAGCTLVFVLSIGYYLTPLLVGGPADQMVSYFIAYYTNTAVNWGLASALGTILLAIVALLYLALGYAVGLERLRVR